MYLSVNPKVVANKALWCKWKIKRPAIWELPFRHNVRRLLKNTPEECKMDTSFVAYYRVEHLRTFDS
jgi:hypothetical protein